MMMFSFVPQVVSFLRSSERFMYSSTNSLKSISSSAFFLEVPFCSKSAISIGSIDRRKQTLEKYNFVFNGGAVNGKLASIIKNQFYAGCVYVELTGYKFAHGHTSKMFFEVNQAVNSG